MSRNRRKTLIERIEEARKSRVVVYVTGDRAPAAAQIADDAVRPLYDHLRKIEKADKLDLFLYSRGGNIDVPWRIATALRATAPNWNILIPFRANSAATLLALGADEIVMGRQAELGPIDPIMSIQRFMSEPGGQGTVVQDSVNVEDIMAYLRFVRERGGLEEEKGLTTSLEKLADRLDPVSLGNAYRTHTHIREVASRMIASRTEPPDGDVTARIVETLAEKTYAHGHAIGRAEAAQIGLPVVEAPAKLDRSLWELLVEYEDLMKLREPMDPAEEVRSQDSHREKATIALVESSWGAHSFTGEVEVKAVRQMPPNLQVSLNLNLQVPPGLDPSQQQAFQQFLQGVQQDVVQQAQQAAQQAVKDQAPIAKLDAGFRGGRWEFSS